MIILIENKIMVKSESFCIYNKLKKSRNFQIKRLIRLTIYSVLKRSTSFVAKINTLLKRWRSEHAYQSLACETAINTDFSE